MKKLLFSILLFCLIPFASASAAEVQNLSWTQLQAQMRHEPKQPVVIEFYSSAPTGLECDRCNEQAAVFAAAAAEYDDTIKFVRVDVAGAAFLVDIGVVGIYPTHLFVRHDVPEGQEMVARKIRGFLSKDELQSLVAEFFEISNH